MRKVFRWIIRFFLIALILMLIGYYDLILYGIRQGYGQLQIIWNTQPIEEVLTDQDFPDSLKAKLLLIKEIKKFAEDSLGITPSKNYTTFYNQEGKPLIWIVTASPPFELKAYEWTFGFLGNFSYKGHFERSRAEKDSAALTEKGFDTDIGEVSAYSTLGWFKDPVLSSMLKNSEGELANLIIHELTHGTLYVKDNVDFNENLASFIGDKGAKIFLQKKYGKTSLQYQHYLEDMHDDSLFFDYILTKAKELDQLYGSSAFKSLSIENKQASKQAFIQKVVNGLVNLPFKRRKYTPDRLKNFKPNNTFFMGYIRYRAQQTNFEQEWKINFKQDLKAYLTYLKKKYPSL